MRLKSSRFLPFRKYGVWQHSQVGRKPLSSFFWKPRAEWVGVWCKSFYLIPAFLLYVGSVIILVFILVFYFAPQCGHSNVLVFTGICSLMGSLSVNSELLMILITCVFSFSTTCLLVHISTQILNASNKCKVPLMCSCLNFWSNLVWPFQKKPTTQLVGGKTEKDFVLLQNSNYMLFLTYLIRDEFLSNSCKVNFVVF